MEYRDKCDKKPFRDEFINNCRKNKQQFGSSVNSGSFQRVGILENHCWMKMSDRTRLCPGFHGTNSFRRVFQREWPLEPRL